MDNLDSDLVYDKIAPKKYNKKPKGLPPFRVMPSRAAKSKVFSYSVAKAKRHTSINKVYSDTELRLLKERCLKTKLVICLKDYQASKYLNERSVKNTGLSVNKFVKSTLNKSSSNDQGSTSVSSSVSQESRSLVQYRPPVIETPSSTSSLSNGYKIIEIPQESLESALEEVRNFKNSVTSGPNCSYIPKRDGMLFNPENIILPSWFKDSMIEHRKAEVVKINQLELMQNDLTRLEEEKLDVLQDMLEIV